MVIIMSDSSSMLTVEEGEKINVIINPLSVTIAEQSYLEQEQITSEEFLGLIEAGGLPTSSQPSVGETLSIYEKNCDQPLLNIAMSDGLSGTYQSAVGAVKCLEENKQKNVTVINSETLWAVQGYIVRKAAKLAEQGLSVENILKKLAPSLENNKSFLIPHDFDYLKRNGRLAPFAANVGGLLKLVPVMTPSKDGRKIEKYALCRSVNLAFEAIAKNLKSLKVGADHLISISHAGAPTLAKQAEEFFRNMFPQAEMEILLLSPVMITQGGPNCLAVQAVLK